jgi:hypothetical protein
MRDFALLTATTAVWAPVALYCGYEIGKAQRSRQIRAYRANARRALPFIRRKYAPMSGGTPTPTQTMAGHFDA